jgi:hypothetical protein
MLAAAAAVPLAGAADAAQYQWRDERGRMVYSDLPPPASLAPSRIIKLPAVPRPAVDLLVPPAAGAATGAKTMAATRPATPGPADAAAAALTLADRELAYRKRVAEGEAQEKKALEASVRKVELAKACSDAQGDIRSMESGQRISRINAAGEREFLSDAERSERLKTARKSVSERC